MVGNLFYGELYFTAYLGKRSLGRLAMDGFVEVSQKEMMEVDGGGKAVSAVTAVVCAAAAKVCFGAVAAVATVAAGPAIVTGAAVGFTAAAVYHGVKTFR